jgi:AAA domain
MSADTNVVPLRRPEHPAFSIKWDADIKRATGGDYMIKGLIPSRGFGVIYGASGTFKSFVALDMAYHAALGWNWAGRRASQGVALYIAAEGMGGMAKRVEGFRMAHGDWPGRVPFALMPASPNLGSTKGDLDRLISSIDSMGRDPNLIVLDTLSQMLHGAEENGAGMTAFIQNAQTLATRFDCFVIAVHHTGHGPQDRMRGHSSLKAAVDTAIRVEKLPDGYSSAVTFEKNKDGKSDITFTATLKTTVVGKDDEGEDVETLIVSSIDEGVAPRSQERKRPSCRQAPLPPSLRSRRASGLTAPWPMSRVRYQTIRRSCPWTNGASVLSSQAFAPRTTAPR